MQLEIAREALLRPLQQVIGAVERRQTMPALGNILISAGEQGVSLTATDLEIELRSEVEVAVERSGETTVPARKLLDICRNLPSASTVTLELADERVLLRAGRSRFSLAPLPAAEFPVLDEVAAQVEFDLPQRDLKRGIDRIGFAMAQNDVRYYLNGLLLELDGNQLRTVATDGHRLSMCEIEAALPADQKQQLIVPRKGVNELARLLEPEAEAPVRVRLGANHIQAALPGLRFTSKLIDGRFPDYTRVVPEGGRNEMHADRETLRQALARTSILSNEKYKGVRLALSESRLSVQTHNPDQEEAEEEIEVEYNGEKLEIGFNVVYLLDILGSLEGETLRAQFNDANSSCLITDGATAECRHVVMPMRL